jgi:hypothetical protein
MTMDGMKYSMYDDEGEGRKQTQFSGNMSRSRKSQGFDRQKQKQHDVADAARTGLVSEVNMHDERGYEFDDFGEMM